MQASETIKTCYVRSGTYSMSSGLSLTAADAGETWSNYPPDGIDSPSLTQLSAFNFFKIGAGADQVTISGLSATGYEHKAHGSCSGAYFVNAYSSSGVKIRDLTVTYNNLTTFDCGIVIGDAVNPIVSFNYVSTAEYVAIGCFDCEELSTQTVWQGNVVYNTDPDGPVGTNAYPIVLSDNPNGSNRYFTITNNAVYYSPTWECYDNHSGQNIFWINNLCVAPGYNTAVNSVAISAASSPTGAVIPLVNGRVVGNILDRGSIPPGVTNAIDMCGNGSCTSQSIDIVGGTVINNVGLFGSGHGVISASPVVTVYGNNIMTLSPEQVSSIRFGGGVTSATFAHGQPNAVVATVQVNMSNTYWAFPTPPGVLSISGTNSGGFVICNLNQICQSAAGTAAGTYNDFSITATLHGMYKSPFTAAAGALTLTAN
jgi:hypothetical protein